MSEEQKRLLEQQLWNIANTLRGKMDADEFRDYILGFIFYKYLSEKMYMFANDILSEDGIKYDDIDESSDEGKEMIGVIKEESLDELGYFLKPSELFHKIAEKGNSKDEKTDNFILNDLAEVLNHIEQSTLGTESEDDFNKLFEDLDLTSTKLGRTEKDKNEIISKVLNHLDKIDFDLESSKSDVLGDAYEYLISQFASGAGKKAGEFYTPQQASRILSKIVTTGKTRIKSVYDPTCGSGSLMLRIDKEVEEVGDYYGQELNRTTYNLCRMNMILHGVHFSKFDIRQEDTLERPQHLDLRFEAVVANPPFSSKWSASQLFMTDDRFSEYGKLAPSSKADFAFIQHMIYHLDDNGIMAVVMPHGVLYRGGGESHIRQYLIEDRNYLDAVIGLPPNIFYGTTIPTCILVFKKCREKPEGILFIDSSQHFQKMKNQNVLRDEDVDRIVDTYRRRESIEKYSHIATLDEIKENDYNLNIPRYVDTFEEEEPVNIQKVLNHLSSLEKEIKELEVVQESFFKELDLSKSFNNKYDKNTPSLRFPEFKDDLERSKIIDISAGKLTNGVFNDPKKVGTGYYLINVKDMYTGMCIDKKQLTRLKIEKKEFEKNKVRYGDIFFTRSSLVKEGIAHSSVNLNNDEDITFDGHLIKLSPNQKVINSLYLTYLLKTSNLRKQLIARGKTGTMTTIGQEDIGSVKLKYPSLNEQKKISSFLSSIDDNINQLVRKKELLEQLRKGILQQMFV